MGEIDPEVEELVRRARAAGGKALGIRLPGPDAPAAKGPDQPKPSKYRNVQQTYNGVRYDSRAEARRAAELDGLAEMGTWYVRQPTFHLGCPENTYRADFLVVNWDGKVHVEDVKGYATPKFLHDVKLWKAHGPCQLRIRGRNGIEFVNGGRCREAIAHGTAGQSTYRKWSEVGNVAAPGSTEG